VDKAGYQIICSHLNYDKCLVVHVAHNFIDADQGIDLLGEVSVLENMNLLPQVLPNTLLLRVKQAHIIGEHAKILIVILWMLHHNLRNFFNCNRHLRGSTRLG
jgi:hypothetical protein